MRSHNRARTRRTLAVITLATLVLGANACSGAGDAPDTAAQTGIVSGTAALGPDLDTSTASLQAPSGFAIEETAEDSPVSVAAIAPGNAVTVVEVDARNDPPSIERQAEVALDGLGRKFELLEPIEVDGVPMWHASGKTAKGQFQEVFGAVHGGKAVRLTIRLTASEFGSRRRAEIVQDILDSWTWRG